VRRRSAKTTLVALSLALSLTAAACGGDDSSKGDDGGDVKDPVVSGQEEATGPPQPGGSLVFGLEAESSGGYCLPTAQLAASGMTTASAVYDTLFMFDDNFEPIPWLAESSEFNADSTQLTLKIRQGIKFHDDSDLTAQTVARNLNLMRGEKAISDETGLLSLLQRFVFDNIVSIEAALRDMGADPGHKHFATPEATTARLEGAGFVDIECWLHEEPTPLPEGDLEPYLEAICLGDHVERMTDDDRRAFVHEVARRLPASEIDYVRLNIRARRAG